MNGVDTAEVQCPYCGETVEVVVDCSIASQEYVEDCHVCCQPMVLTVEIGTHGDVSVAARREND